MNKHTDKKKERKEKSARNRLVTATYTSKGNINQEIRPLYIHHEVARGRRKGFYKSVTGI